LVLRLFPIAVTLLSRVLEPVAPIWLLQAVRRLQRNPTPAGLLVLLLLLATGLGVVGAAFSASLERSQVDQVFYQVGADFRVVHTGGAWAATGQGPAQALSTVTGVAGTTEVLRGNGWATTTGFGNDVIIMAVEPQEFADVAWYRPDFSRAALGSALTGQYAPSSLQGLAIPPDAERLSIWVTQRRPVPRYELMARLRDAKGRTFDVSFGIVEARGWQQVAAPIKTPEPAGARSGLPPIQYERPFAVAALTVASRRGAWQPDALFLDDLTAVLASGASVSLSDFQQHGNWRVLQDYGSTNPIALEPNETIARSGRQSLSLSWGAGGAGIRGLQYGAGLEPVPALASPAFLERNKLRVGDSVTVWAFGAYTPLQVQGVADYFPTVYPDKDAFVIVDVHQVTAFSTLHAATPQRPNGETWVRAATPNIVDPVALRDAARSQGFWVFSVEDAQRSLGSQVADPLVTAGWSGLLALAFLTVVLATVSGLLLYSYIDAREHQTEFALMRTLGFSRNELGGVVWFNLVVVAGVGVALGSLLGFQLGRWLLPLLEVAEGGRRITPPMVMETNWAILWVTYGVLGVAAVTTVVILTWLLGRLELQRVLRMGET
ncbi:MAG: FtsX-like permease family protein, partial [SAR202 cluster bacterium]|nr:FtsX-like permease family protein [SAR202 cluster bacterium]